MADVDVTDDQINSRVLNMTEGTREAVTTAAALLSILTTRQGTPDHTALATAATLLEPHTDCREHAESVVREALRTKQPLTHVWARMCIEWETRAAWLTWEIEVGRGGVVHLAQEADGYELGVTDDDVYAHVLLTEAEMDAVVGVYLAHTGRKAVPASA